MSQQLWRPGASGGPGVMVAAKVGEIVQGINRKMASKATSAVNELRNAELEVLKGQRSGRKYRKYPYKSKYTASAPGEPPARRTGNLRLHWNGNVRELSPSSLVAELEAQESYAGYLENGTSRMAPRPFKDRILEKAEPSVRRIFEDIGG